MSSPVCVVQIRNVRSLQINIVNYVTNIVIHQKRERVRKTHRFAISHMCTVIIRCERIQIKTKLHFPTHAHARACASRIGRCPFVVFPIPTVLRTMYLCGRLNLIRVVSDHMLCVCVFVGIDWFVFVRCRVCFYVCLRSLRTWAVFIYSMPLRALRCKVNKEYFIELLAHSGCILSGTAPPGLESHRAHVAYYLI